MESEEGELHDDSPDYEPLERPRMEFPNEAAIKSQAHYSTDESSLDEQDVCIPKRQKITDYKKKDKYNVWSDCTDDLLLSLDNISMNNLDRSRNVENYPYRRHDYSSHGSHSSLETAVSENYCRRKKQPKSYRRRHCKSGHKDKTRVLSDLQVTTSDPDEIVAKEISKKLCEPNTDLILSVVTVLGVEKAIEVYYETQSIEQSGGILVIDRSRRRTSGGVYLYLIRCDEKISSSQKSLIFDNLKVVKMSGCKSLKRKRVIRCDDSAYKDHNEKDKTQEHDILDNPPPSPATEADPVIVVPLNRLTNSQETESGDSEKMDIV